MRARTPLCLVRYSREDVCHICQVFTWKEHGRCYLLRFHCRFASNLKWSSSKQIFSASCSSFDIVARIEYSFKLFLSIFTLTMRNFGFESQVRWPTNGNGFWLVYEDLSIQNRDMVRKIGCGLSVSPQLVNNCRFSCDGIIFQNWNPAESVVSSNVKLFNNWEFYSV